MRERRASNGEGAHEVDLLVGGSIEGNVLAVPPCANKFGHEESLGRAKIDDCTWPILIDREDR